MCLKFVKIREFYEIFKIRKNSFYNITSNCIRIPGIRTAKNSSAVDYTEATGELEHWAVEDCCLCDEEIFGTWRR